MTNTILPTIENTREGLAVSSETISQGANIQHKNVLELIEKYRDDFESFGGVAFQTRPFQTAGGIQNKRIAMLNEHQATLLLTYLRNSEVVRHFKKSLVKAFYEMAESLRKAQQPDNRSLEVRTHELMAELGAVVEQQKKALEEAAPKIEYHDTYVADDDLLTFRTVSADLNIAESQLRNLLLERGWIYKQQSSRWSQTKGQKVTVNRYSAYSDKRPYFQPVMNHDVPRFKGEVMHTLKITPAGARAVARLVNQHRESSQDTLEVITNG